MCKATNGELSACANFTNGEMSERRFVWTPTGTCRNYAGQSDYMYLAFFIRNLSSSSSVLRIAEIIQPKLLFCVTSSTFLLLDKLRHIACISQ